jgi:NAD-dependent deacetylase
MEGLWANFDPQSLATEAGFRQDPRRVWSWYAWRRERVADARPNPGHVALARMEALVPGLVVVTQNVDGLHAEAGSTDVVELHGNIRRVKCLDRGHPYAGTLPPYTEGEEQDPPPCPVCGSPLRPDVVWFGEMLPEDALVEATRAAEGAEVYLSVGTSAAVYPAAGLPVLARACGAYVAEINPERSDIADRLNEHVACRAAEGLPALVDAVRAMHGSPLR